MSQMTERVNNNPRSLRFASNIKRFISKFPELKYTGTVIYCSVCKQYLNGCTSAYACRRHIATASHIQNGKLKYPYWVFTIDLIFMLSACGIPQWVLEKEHFRSFWKEYNPKWPLPTRQQVRSQFPRAIKILEEHIEKDVHGKKIWVTVHQTTNPRENTVTNVLIRILDPTGPSSSYLIASKTLEETNSDALQQFVRNTLNKFSIQTHDVLMLVTDGVALMREAGVKLKTIYPDLLHATCLLHAFHDVAEEIRNSYPDVDTLISSTRMVFVKSPQRLKTFRRQCPGIPTPPEPTLTRCGTWIQTVYYYNEHWEKVKSMIFTLDPKAANSIRESQQQFNNIQVREDLLTIRNNYGILTDAIDAFQSGLSLSQSLDVVDKVKVTLQTLIDDPGLRAARKFQDVLRQNPGITELIDHNKCLSDGSASELQKYYLYANITSLDIECSLLKYTSTFTGKRRSLSADNQEGLLMMQMYANQSKNTSFGQE